MVHVTQRVEHNIYMPPSRLSVCLSVCLPICLSVCLSACLLLFIFLHLTDYLYTCLFTCPYIYLFRYLGLFPFQRVLYICKYMFYLSRHACLSFSLTVRTFVYLYFSSCFCISDHLYICSLCVGASLCVKLSLCMSVCPTVCLSVCFC